MLECEQLFYTTALIDNRSGYQITAKSTGITNEIIQELEGYMYPIGIDSSEFISSYSLLFLKNKKIAFSKITNIGIGYDGRDNTLYNHTIILQDEQFKKLECDSKNLKKYFLENSRKKGQLDQIQIDEKLDEIDWDFFKKIPRNILETILDAFFSNTSKKIILVGIKEKDFISEIISVIPKSMRRLSYSNKVIDANRQIKYNIIQIDDFTSTSLEKNNVVDTNKIPTFYENDNDPILERTIKTIVQVLKNKDSEVLRAIQNEFESIDDLDVRNKIKLATYFTETQKNHNDERSKKFAKDLLKILEEFNEDTIMKYLSRIKKFLPERDYEQYSEKIEFKRIMYKFKNEEINFETISKIFKSLYDWDYESRDKIFKQLIKHNLKEIKEKGTKIIIDAKYNFEEVVLDNFVENKELNKSVLDAFDENINFDSHYKKNYFEHIIERVATNNQNLAINLLRKPVFNFKDQYDSRHYKNILKTVLDNNEFLDKVDFQSLLLLIDEIFVKIKKIIEYVPPSGINGTTDSNIYELKKIIKGFQKTLDSIEKKNLNEELSDKITEQNVKINDFLEKHKIGGIISNFFD